MLYYPDGTERADAWDVAELQAEYRLRRKEQMEYDFAHGSGDRKNEAYLWLLERRFNRRRLGLPDDVVLPEGEAGPKG